ncbi:MAG: hypothetical protein HC814_02520 [Rhodobacteraceae bacterium]|nr:hypothetical protein [Paracoccaceae bacterium]
MRRFYDAFAPMLGPVESREREDEEDAKERHFKWFEKLCERNLGLSFRSRGRPGKKSR